MSYSQQVLIEGTSEQIFNAIAKNVQQWWGITDSPVSVVGDEFTTSFDKTYWKFTISKFEPNVKIVWDCIDARHIHTGYDGIKSEWLGTSVEWTLEELDTEQTIVHFQHNGLTPDLNCYEICTPAWELFVTKSLKSFVETGKGMPSLI